MNEPARRVVLATGNAGKLRELRETLAPLAIDLVGQGELGVEAPEEPGVTFVENALIKARHAARATGLPAIADDSGIAVDALDGAPGVRSARFAGESATDEANRDLLLDRLRGVAQHERGAAFHAVIVHLLTPDDPVPLICHGVWHGQVLEAARGEGGFGYDPVFAPTGFDGRSAAELSAEEKNAVSHRGRAVQRLLAALTGRPAD